MANKVGFEPTTPGFGIQNSDQLSYLNIFLVAVARFELACEAYETPDQPLIQTALIFMVTLEGIEPVMIALKTQDPMPLDDRAIILFWCKE